MAPKAIVGSNVEVSIANKMFLTLRITEGYLPFAIIATA